VRRGDIVTVVLQGELGKPRPALILQSDLFNVSHASLVVLPITSTIEASPIIRITIEPSEQNGLQVVSQVMIDKPMPVRREKIGRVIGRLEDDAMQRVSRATIIWLDLA